MIEQRVDRVLAAVHQVDARPAGSRPARSAASIRAIVIGVFSDGLRTTRVAAGDGVGQEPQRDHAGEVERRDDARRRRPAGGSSARRCPRRCPRGCCPCISDGMPVATSTFSMPRRSSPSASASVLPHSCVISRAISLKLRVEQRLEPEQRLDAVAGRRAAPRRQRRRRRRARPSSTSSADDSGAAASTSPVAGLFTGIVCVPSAASHWPPT